MTQQTRHWRSGNGEKAWLSALVETMEQVSRPELRSTRCPRNVAAAVQSQLARPTMQHGFYGSSFSVRN